MTMFQYYKRSRHFVFSAFIAFVFVLLCQNTAFARASSNGDLPTKADLQAQLDSLNKQKDLSAQDKLVQQDLTDTLATLDKIDRVKEETVQLRQKVAEAPEKMRQATAALTALSDVDNDEETRKILSTLSLRQLETRVAQALDDLQNAQNGLITASWFRYRRSPNACKMRCITLRSSCNKFAVVWMGLMSARQPYVPARKC